MEMGNEYGKPYEEGVVVSEEDIRKISAVTGALYRDDILEVLEEPYERRLKELDEGGSIPQELLGLNTDILFLYRLKREISVYRVNRDSADEQPNRLEMLRRMESIRDTAAKLYKLLQYSSTRGKIVFEDAAELLGYGQDVLDMPIYKHSLFIPLGAIVDSAAKACEMLREEGDNYRRKDRHVAEFIRRIRLLLQEYGIKTKNYRNGSLFYCVQAALACAGRNLSREAVFHLMKTANRSSKRGVGP